ncbi:hypothetical protein Jiend_63470 [Micromonospora endophytica]|nr:hypothetical protein Jiend_63470 [Micromonospora endophytica]
MLAGVAPRSRRPPARPSATASTAHATANSTAPCTPSPCPRLRYDEPTRAYADRRRTQGKTDREIKRCLKRYIARDLYQRL